MIRRYATITGVHSNCVQMIRWPLFRWPSLAFGCPGVQMTRCSGHKVFRWQGVQVTRCSGVQVTRCSDDQVFRWTGVQVTKCSGIQVFRCLGDHGFRWPGVQVTRCSVTRCSGDQVFRWPGVQETRRSDAQVFKYKMVSTLPYISHTDELVTKWLGQSLDDQEFRWMTNRCSDGQSSEEYHLFRWIGDHRYKWRVCRFTSRGMNDSRSVAVILQFWLAAQTQLPTT